MKPELNTDLRDTEPLQSPPAQTSWGGGETLRDVLPSQLFLGGESVSKSGCTWRSEKMNFFFLHSAACGVLLQDLEVTHHVRRVNRWPERLHGGVSEQ